MTTRQQIAAIVQRETGIEWEHIVRPGRWSLTVMARDLAIAVARRTTQMSYPEIAAWLNMKSHSSVIAAAERAIKRQPERIRKACAELGQKGTVIHLPVIDGKPDKPPAPEHHRRWVDGVMKKIRDRLEHDEMKRETDRFNPQFKRKTCVSARCRLPAKEANPRKRETQN